MSMKAVGIRPENFSSTHKTTGFPSGLESGDMGSTVTAETRFRLRSHGTVETDSGGLRAET